MFFNTCVYKIPFLGYMQLYEDTEDDQGEEEERKKKRKRKTSKKKNKRVRERAEILLTRFCECAEILPTRRRRFSFSERELEHEHDDDGDVDGDVDAAPNKLDHAEDEDDECHVVRARDVDDGHDGHDDRP